MTTDGQWAPALLAWYRRHRRQMPWREAPTPYRVWISEIMLQQTRVDTVIPYFERFLDAFPDVESLAAAAEHDVLRLWQGLGYYSRARNLLRAAKLVVAEHDGKLPTTAAGLRRLPGFGPYTAAAVASIAYEEAEPVVDGNVLRVVGRLDTMSDDIAKPAVRNKVTARLRPEIAAADSAGDFNQAMMELGATVCTPRKPACLLCPLRPWCRAAVGNEVDLFPVKSKRGAVPHYPVVAALIAKDDAVLLRQRPADGMLAGLWDLPQKRLPADGVADVEALRAVLRELGGEGLATPASPAITLAHAYTHFRITIHVWEATGAVATVDGDRWVTRADLADWPVPRSTAKILAAAGWRSEAEAPA